MCNMDVQEIFNYAAEVCDKYEIPATFPQKGQRKTKTRASYESQDVLVNLSEDILESILTRIFDVLITDLPLKSYTLIEISGLCVLLLPSSCHNDCVKIIESCI